MPNTSTVAVRLTARTAVRNRGFVMAPSSQPVPAVRAADRLPTTGLVAPVRIRCDAGTAARLARWRQVRMAVMIESQNGRRVVVTGVGVVACCGTGRAEFWAGLAKPVMPAVVRPVLDFDAGCCELDRVAARRLDRFALFAVAAAGEALGDAGLLDPADRGPAERAGVVLGTSLGGASSWEPQALVL